jgi:hypothetical protein
MASAAEAREMPQTARMNNPLMELRSGSKKA